MQPSFKADSRHPWDEPSFEQIDTFMAPIEVIVETLKPGWTVFHVPISEFRKNVELERLPGILNTSLVRWLAENSSRRVRAVLPIVEDGFTTVLHVWWD